MIEQKAFFPPALRAACMLRQQLISVCGSVIEQETVFPPARCAACMQRQQLIFVCGLYMRSAPGVWYTGGYYEKIYQYV